ncbi:NAD-dependent epimerase/dehydratase family protein [Pseudonocardia adelaidensis]|uniref:NAD-dependent epimerase/dehydratase family protein n=1 Tax=Pseudonocardia adelaidensis TaxID=648754 RepID=A0ABP9NEG4_9PSEU
MRVVVVGATGNIGTSLVPALVADPDVTSVLGLARRSPAWRPDDVEWATADIATDDVAAHLRGADALVHLGWLIQPSHDPILTWRVNVLGGIRLFRAAVEAGVRTIVHASSVGAYSPGPKDTPVDESWPTDGWPTAAYPREKAYLERVLDRIEAEHPQLRIVRIRPGFVFKRETGAEQRRLFVGPFLPNRLVRPSLIPVVPDLPGLRFQVVHSLDAADAFRRAVVRDVRGAFNVATDPVVDAQQLARLLGARPVRLPARPARAAVATAWQLRLTPASPHLLDALLRVPIMSTDRARSELGWQPRHDSLETLDEFLGGLRDGAGMDTPPLSPRTGGPLRSREVGTGAGEQP